jgi:hypothetical protein
MPTLVTRILPLTRRLGKFQFSDFTLARVVQSLTQYPCRFLRRVESHGIIGNDIVDTPLSFSLW